MDPDRAVFEPARIRISASAAPARTSHAPGGDAAAHDHRRAAATPSRTSSRRHVRRQRRRVRRNIRRTTARPNCWRRSPAGSARRYGVTVGARPRSCALNGTREGLFNAAMALCPETKNGGKRPVVLMPNPFYQVYAVAALAVGAEPVYRARHGGNRAFCRTYAGAADRAAGPAPRSPISARPPTRRARWRTRDYWAELIALAEKHDFLIFADECYSEIYRDAPPPGALRSRPSDRRRPRAGGDVPLAVEAVEPAGPALGLCRGRAASIAAMQAAAQPMPARRCRCRCSGWPRRVWADEEHVDGEPRALQAEIRDRRRDLRRRRRLLRRRQAGSSCGCRSRTARRRR